MSNEKNDIQWKFYSYMIDYELAKYNKKKENVEDLNYGRSKLSIDVKAREIALEKKNIIKNYNQSIEDDLNDKALKLFEEELEKRYLLSEKNFESDIYFPETAGDLLEHLSSKACRYSTIDQYSNTLLGLKNFLAKIASNKFFSPDLDDETKERFKSTTLALSHIGIQNARYVAPIFIITKNFVNNTSFNLANRKIYDYSVQTGNIAMFLTEFYNSKNNLRLDPYTSYTIGSLSELSFLPSLKLYFEIFAKIWSNEIKISKIKQDIKLQSALNIAHPSILSLRKSISLYSKKMTLNIFKNYNFKRLPISETFNRYINSNILNSDGELDYISKYTEILIKSIALSEMLTLKRVHLLGDSNVEKHLISAKITNAELSFIMTKNVRFLSFKKNYD